MSGPTPDIPVPGGTWTCPLHADVRETAPGTCPRCGATLVPLGADPGPAGSPPDGAAGADAAG